MQFLGQRKVFMQFLYHFSTFMQSKQAIELETFNKKCEIVQDYVISLLVSAVVVVALLNFVMFILNIFIQYFFIK